MNIFECLRLVFPTFDRTAAQRFDLDPPTASGFILNEFSEGSLSFGAAVVFTAFIPLLNHLKNSLDGFRASCLLTRFEFLSQLIKIFRAHVLDFTPNLTGLLDASRVTRR
jgi:hypothetical protein